MSQEVAIRVSGLGKRYRLGHTLEMSMSFRERLMCLPFELAERLRRTGNVAAWRRRRAETFWALRDLSFEVRRGEVLAVIGRNGAGKSTLLKIFSRITPPTTGRAVLNGSVRSLLEIGTGFHYELTGRENIYLNGAILGMRRAEIDRKFDEIVAFSEVEKFLDTPVKRYSSGMFVKLGFAVAAHLDSDILLVDEVLAVGDLQFQRKCLGKVQEVAAEGRTVLFVSHNMQVLQRVCTTGLYLKEGSIVQHGDIDSVVKRYISDIPQTRSFGAITPSMHTVYPPPLEVFRIRLLNHNALPTASVLVDEAFTLQLDYRIHDSGQSYRVGLAWRNSEGILLASVISTAEGVPWLRGQPHRSYRLTIEAVNPFLPGGYALDVVVRNYAEEIVDMIQGLPLTVEALSVSHSSVMTIGNIRLPARLRVEELQHAL